jgi:hypothetical protein
VAICPQRYCCKKEYNIWKNWLHLKINKLATIPKTKVYNPQKAEAYVGKGVLRNGGITPVPNGPLIKKKGPFKGSGLKDGGKMMLKRKDGSVSKRGLWDNIRAAKGSGKKPTAAMLKQEKKIKAKTKK